MRYKLAISPSAEEALYRMLQETQENEGLFEALYSSFEELAAHPVTVMKDYPQYSDYPYITDTYNRYVFLVVFRFSEDEKTIEILGINYLRY